MGDDEARVDASFLDQLEEWLHVALDVGLPGPDGERAVHDGAHGEVVDEPRVDPDDRDGAAVAAGYRASDFPGHLTGVSWWGPEDRRSGDGELNVVG